MTNSDWYAEVEGKSASLPTLAPSSDLFDGELFSDELIDIYNTAVGEGEHPGTHENGKLISSYPYFANYILISNIECCSHSENPN